MQEIPWNLFFTSNGETVLHESHTVEQLQQQWIEVPGITSLITARATLWAANIFKLRGTLTGSFVKQGKWEEAWSVFAIKRDWSHTERVLTFIELGYHDIATLLQAHQQFPDLFRNIRVDEFRACFVNSPERLNELQCLLDNTEPFSSRVGAYDHSYQHELFRAIWNQDIAHVRSAANALPSECVSRLRDQHAQTPLERLLGSHVHRSFFQSCFPFLLQFESSTQYSLMEVYIIAIQLLRQQPTMVQFRLLLDTLLPDPEQQTLLLSLPMHRFPLAHRLIRHTWFAEDDLVSLLKHISTKPDRLGDTLLSWALFRHRYDLVECWIDRDAADLELPDHNGVLPLAHMMRREVTTSGIRIFLRFFLWKMPWQFWYRSSIVRTAHLTWRTYLARRGIRLSFGSVPQHIHDRYTWTNKYLADAGLRWPIRSRALQWVFFPEFTVTDDSSTIAIRLGETCTHLHPTQLHLSNVLTAATLVDECPDSGVYNWHHLPPEASMYVAEFLARRRHPEWNIGNETILDDEIALLVPSVYLDWVRELNMRLLISIWYVAHYLDISRLEHLMRLTVLTRVRGAPLSQIRSMCGITSPPSEEETRLFEYELSV